MNLRAHHLLCLYGFRGLGYSWEFINNLTTILNKLRKDYNQKIKLIATVDDICQYCPYCKDGKCQDKEKDVQRFDRKVLSRINVNVGSHLKAKKIFELIKANIKTSDLRKWCKGCQWYRFKHCSDGLKNKDLP